MKKDREFLIGYIIVPIVIVIISASISWLITNYQISVSQQQFNKNFQQTENSQLPNRIQNARNIIQNCNIANRDMILLNLSQATTEWLYENYTSSNAILNSIKPYLEQCVTTITTSFTTATTISLPPAGVQPSVTSYITAPSASTVSVLISDASAKVQEIDIESKNAISGSLNVNQVLQPTSTLTNAYLYFQVSETNFTDNDVSNATINFKVEQSWLSQYNITAGKIALYRFNIVWSSLPTTQLSNDSTYVYYSAASPGLSLFAIAAQQLGFSLPSNYLIYIGIGVVAVIIVFFVFKSQKGKYD